MLSFRKFFAVFIIPHCLSQYRMIEVTIPRLWLLMKRLFALPGSDSSHHAHSSSRRDCVARSKRQALKSHRWFEGASESAAPCPPQEFTQSLFERYWGIGSTRQRYQYTGVHHIIGSTNALRFLWRGVTATFQRSSFPNAWTRRRDFVPTHQQPSSWKECMS